MADKKFVVPEILAILPVRDTVLFPGAVLPLTVGRESSLALVNALQGEEKLMGVVAQLDPRVEDPSAADLHKVGTLAKVHKTVKMPNGNVVIFLEGLQRIQIVDLIGLRPYLRARVEPEPDISGDSGQRTRSAATQRAGPVPRRGEPFAAAFRRFAVGSHQLLTIRAAWRTLSPARCRRCLRCCGRS